METTSDLKLHAIFLLGIGDDENHWEVVAVCKSLARAEQWVKDWQEEQRELNDDDDDAYMIEHKIESIDFFDA